MHPSRDSDRQGMLSRKEYTLVLVKGILIGVLLMAVAFAVSSAMSRRDVDVSVKNAVVGVSPHVTINKNVATVQCPLSPQLMYPKGEVKPVTFANAKNEVDNHGCPGMVKTAHGVDMYWKPLGCSATATEVTMEIAGVFYCAKYWFKVDSQNKITCRATSCLGVTQDGIYGWNCGTPNFVLLRKPPQLPYVRPVGTAAAAHSLITMNHTCPGLIIVSTNGQEEFQLKPWSCYSPLGNNHPWMAQADSVLANGDILNFVVWGFASPNSPTLVEHCSMVRGAGVGTSNFKNTVAPPRIGVGKVFSAALLNSAGIPFSDTFTCKDDRIKFVY